MTNKFAWISVAGTILFTIYGQLIIKWRVKDVTLPDGFMAKLPVVAKIVFDPWVFTGLASAGIAALFWMVAMTRLPLSLAYPFTSLSFVIVALLGIVFIGEPLTAGKIGGICLVLAGLFLIART